MSMPRVLFTTIPVEVLRSQNTLKGKAFDTTSSYQSWTAMNPRLLQLRVTNPAFGLRFIRENVRGVEILEYPTWEEYRAALRRGWDVVGISFFTWTTPDALQMAAMAREAGAGQVWAGNYGVMTPDISRHFDRVYSGNCEAALKKDIEGVDLPAVEHPVIVGKTQLSLMHEKVGFLYTKRGCGSHCTFCPTPRFAKGDQQTVITGTDRVLDAYARLNASPVIIFDETFMENESHADAVIEQLARRKLRWVCLTRADRIVGRVAELKTRGLHSAIIGVESIRDANLHFVAKRERTDLIKETIRELSAHGCFPSGTYMLGFPGDTVESVQEDLRALESWGFFLMQFTILTPYPGTPLYKQLQPKITDQDWRHYDSYHLVWDHPSLSPEQARELLFQALRRINRPSQYLRKISTDYLRRRMPEARRATTRIGVPASP
ncbi:MAG: B12-binding domain-containing radical SAM protein [Thermoanaerobaculia bacterium]